jgi:hypothetical protein
VHDLAFHNRASDNRCVVCFEYQRPKERVMFRRNGSKGGKRVINVAIGYMAGLGLAQPSRSADKRIQHRL